MGLKEDFDRYFRSRDKNIISVIADKLMQCEEVINGRKRINSFIFNAVALSIGSYAFHSKNNKNSQAASTA